MQLQGDTSLSKMRVSMKSMHPVFQRFAIAKVYWGCPVDISTAAAAKGYWRIHF